MPQVRVPSIVDAPLIVSVHVPGQFSDPSSQWRAVVPLMAICPVLVAGAHTSRFQQERSPVGHQLEAPRQLTSGGLALGSWEQGAANQLKKVSASA